MCNSPMPIDPEKIPARPWRVVRTPWDDVRLESATGEDIVTQAGSGCNWPVEAQFIADVVNAAYAIEQRYYQSFPTYLPKPYQGRSHPRIGGAPSPTAQAELMYEVDTVDGDSFTAHRRKDLEVQSEGG